MDTESKPLEKLLEVRLENELENQGRFFTQRIGKRRSDINAFEEPVSATRKAKGSVLSSHWALERPLTRSTAKPL